MQFARHYAQLISNAITVSFESSSPSKSRFTEIYGSFPFSDRRIGLQYINSDTIFFSLSVNKCIISDFRIHCRDHFFIA